MTIGRIFDIQRFSTHDGPGIRTTVFFKGCPLGCLWCHNPDGRSAQRQLSFAPERCVACGDCLGVCPSHAHAIDLAASPERLPGHVLDRGRCRACGACVDVCTSGALEMVGRDVSVSEVLAEVLADRAFYAASGGGLTLSGGEPLAQIDFAAALLEAAKAQGVHCSLETSGFAAWEHFQRILHLVDLFFFDCKDTDPARHLQHTGASCERIVENLRMLYAAGAKIVLRCPIIPGCNDREDHFAGIAALARQMPGLEAIELLAYHPLGKAKAERLGIGAAPASETRVPDQHAIQGWLDWFTARGIRVHCRRARGYPVGTGSPR